MFEKISGLVSLMAAGVMIMVVGLGVAINCNGRAQKCTEQQIEPPDHIIF